MHNHHQQYTLQNLICLSITVFLSLCHRYWTFNSCLSIYVGNAIRPDPVATILIVISVSSKIYSVIVIQKYSLIITIHWKLFPNKMVNQIYHRLSHQSSRPEIHSMFCLLLIHPMLKFHCRFACHDHCGPQPEFPLASPGSSVDHHFLGPMLHTLALWHLAKSMPQAGIGLMCKCRITPITTAFGRPINSSSLVRVTNGEL